MAEEDAIKLEAALTPLVHNGQEQVDDDDDDDDDQEDGDDDDTYDDDDDDEYNDELDSLRQEASSGSILWSVRGSHSAD